MTTLYLDHRHYQLSHDNAQIIIRHQDERRALPLRHIQRVVISGRSQIDTGLLHELSERQIPLTCLHSRKPRRTAHLGYSHHGQALRRLGQYALSLYHPHDSTQLSSELVHAKLRSQRKLLQQALATRHDQRKVLSDTLITLGRLENYTGPEFSHTTSKLRGLEGAGAAAYFTGLGSLFAPSLNFTGRNRRPPRDPVNACLSLGYTLLHHDAVSACHAAGLDPLLGYYHKPSYRRESLACDLVEPLRARVDRLIWSLFSKQTLRLEHFQQSSDACLLNKQGRKHFYYAWERQAAPLRRHLRQHALKVARLCETIAAEEFGGNHETY